MEKSIKLTLIANAGVLVHYNGIGLLIDGIHHEQGHPFNRVSSANLRDMRQGSGLFSDLDFLLFTHYHPDHFSPLYVTALIHARPVQGIVLPGADDPSPELRVMLNHIRQKNIASWTLGLAPGTTRTIALTRDVFLMAIGTRHMGPQYQTISNDCFLLTVAGKNLLFTGDGDPVREYYQAALVGIRLAAVFVNPLFYHHPKGQDIINSIFAPQHIVLYHLPPADNDPMGLLSLVQRARQRYERPDMQTHLWAQENQSLLINELG